RLDPGVAVLNRVAVILEHDRAVLPFLNAADAAGRGGDLLVVDDGQAVLDDGEPGLLEDLVALAARGVEGDVVGLPPERRLASVDRWDDLLIDRAAVVALGLEAVGVEHLELVDPLEVDAAVPPGLPLGVGHVGNVELEMHLEVAELLLRLDARLTHRDDAV